MWFKLFPKRFAILRAFVYLFLAFSFMVRLVLLVWDYSETDTNVITLARTFLTGFFFDLGTVSFFIIPYILYLLLFPRKWFGSLLDKIFHWSGLFLSLTIVFFSFFAEITFWDEFRRRFNFIAVDYLVYTYEVVRNINESYPLPILLSGVMALVGLFLFIFWKKDFFRQVFTAETSLKTRAVAAFPWFAIPCVFGFFITNDQAEWSENRYNSELSKAGIYSFFSAFRNNELAYPEFYRTLPQDQAMEKVKQPFIANGDKFLSPSAKHILRTVHAPDSAGPELRPNVVLICVESLSGQFLTSFGGKDDLTPNLDSLANESLFFTRMFATGTRTVRGMEAITLSIPPTPGMSIVKRLQNTGLFTIGEIFKIKGYQRNFFYGGDGYFDNMNSFFGGNGFNIIDRGRGILLDKQIETTRTLIGDDEVTFENAWGVCDEDIYNKVIREADKAHEAGTLFFDFVMTTSNHKPYTYPEGKINIPSGTGRQGAVRYTDYAIGQFLRQARTKPWFANTVFVIMSDHCANSAGRWELDVQNFHIPAIIYNLPKTTPQKVDKLCSQIDIFPTLFGALDWEYTSNLFGCDILKMKRSDGRAFIGNYRKLGLLQGDSLVVLGDQKMANFYLWDREDNSLKVEPMDSQQLESAIANYQVADYLYNHQGLMIKLPTP